MGFLAGKRAVIAGIASDRSIAWGIAQAMAREGAEIALSYQSERLAERVREMAAEIGANICLPLDVSSDDEIVRMYESLAGHWPSFDILVHSVAFAPREQLVGRYLDTITREGSQIDLALRVLAPDGRELAGDGQVQIIDYSAELGTDALEVHVIGIEPELYAELFHAHIAAFEAMQSKSG